MKSWKDKNKDTIEEILFELKYGGLGELLSGILGLIFIIAVYIGLCMFRNWLAPFFPNLAFIA